MPAKKNSLDFNFRVMMYFEDLHATEDLLAFITRSQLHCETLLVTLLKKRVKRPSALKFDSLDCSSTLDLCYALGYISTPLKNGLKQLNDFRRQIAQNIEYVIYHQLNFLFPLPILFISIMSVWTAPAIRISSQAMISLWRRVFWQLVMFLKP